MPCSPRRRIRIVTVAERIDGQVAPGWAGFASAQLDTSNGCQDHTVLPYANSIVRLAPAARSRNKPALRSPCAPTLPRPPHPNPRFVTTRDPPLLPGRDEPLLANFGLSENRNIFR